MKPFIDFTLLKEDATLDEFKELCSTALAHTDYVRGICVPGNPFLVRTCKNLVGHKMKVSAVNDFPHGNRGYIVKRDEAFRSKDAGADEIDTVINTGFLRSGEDGLVLDDLFAVTRIFPGATKVILEICHLWYNEETIKRATRIVDKSGAFCVKTSTGFNKKDIPIEEKVKFAKWMHEAAPDLMVKIAGGVKSMAHVNVFLDVVPEDKLIVGASGKIWES